VKILFDHGSAFLLAHGGFQIQIEQTKSALESAGVAVEPLRWWDASQRGDIIHYFGRPPFGYVAAAQRKGFKVVIAPLLTGMGSRSKFKLRAQRIFISACKKFCPRDAVAAFSWDSFQLADACIALTDWEAHLMSWIFGAAPEKVHIVPNGVEKIFLNSAPERRGEWLVCTATITERKRVVELARAAVQAQTPLWIIGKPYSETEPYAKIFFELQSRHSKILRYEGAVQDRAKLAQIYRQARGFVLLSAMESLSLSALEAAACECPLLLSDLPWARTVFKENATYCPIASASATAESLRKFYDAAPVLTPPPKPPSWSEVAERLKKIYENLPSTSR
jgi:glycosyltransferase involved in cell wall biosynthesis